MTAVQDIVRNEEEQTVVTLLKFEMFDITLSRLKLEAFDICVFQEPKSHPFADPQGQFVECRFDDRPMVEFLAAVCLHVYDHFYEDIPQLSAAHHASLLPSLCGVASVAKDKEQNLVINFVEIGRAHV